MSREVPSRSTLYAAWLCVIAEAAEMSKSFRGLSEAAIERREVMAMQWVEHYARQGEHPDIAEVDSHAERLAAQYLE
jgi:hypothetical protein